MYMNGYRGLCSVVTWWLFRAVYNSERLLWLCSTVYSYLGPCLSPGYSALCLGVQILNTYTWTRILTWLDDQMRGSYWNLECRFLWREENRRTRRKTLGAGTKTNNKLSPHVTLGSGIKPGHSGNSRRALSPLHLHPVAFQCCVALCMAIQSCVALCGYLRLYSVVYGYLGLCNTVYGYLELCSTCSLCMATLIALFP